MKRTYLVTTIMAIIAMPTATASVAQAAVYYPWCVYYGTPVSDVYNCGFVSWSQCMATARNAGGFCQPNPAYFERCRTNCNDPNSLNAVRQPINAP
jgi:hypothetical protein